MLGAPVRGAAQVGTTTDIITGTVTGPDSQPLPGAVVQATSLETQVSRQRSTDARGRFTILFPDGGGQYQLVVRYLGMAPARVTVARQADEDRSGANVPQGSFTYALRDRDLAWGGVSASPFDQGYTQNQLGGGMGGPVVPNRLFAFGALQGRWRGQALPSLATADAASLERLGVSPDSAARFLALAGTTGAPMTVPDLPGDPATDNSVALLRIDWNITDAQTLMLRLDGRWTSQDPTRVSPRAPPATGGTRSQRDGVERRVVLGRHLADGERRTAHLWHSARGGSLQRCARLQPRHRFPVRHANRPDPQ